MRALGIVLLLSAVSAGGKTIASTVPSASEAAVARHVEMLHSASTETREAARDWLLNSDPGDLPLIESAAKADGGPEPASLLEKLRPLAKARAAAEQLQQNYLQWNRSTALDAYRTCGVHDPTWDALAERGITLFTSGKSSDRRAAFDVLEHVTSDLKCVDPLVLYFDARVLQADGRQEFILSALNTYAAACERFEGTGYPPDRKCFAMLRLNAFAAEMNAEKGNQNARAMGQRYANEALDLWPQVLAEPGLPVSNAWEIGDLTLAAQVRFGADRAEVLRKMLPALRRALARRPAVALAFEGQAYVEYAWDARGKGWASTVTPEGWKRMAERLKIAQDKLQRAYDADPSDPCAASEMLLVALGGGGGMGRADMEKWFARAVAANPQHLRAYPYMGHSDAYDFKLRYLLPRWHGSAAEMLEFGRQCAATRNWRDGVTDVLIDAHAELAKESGDEAGYWRDPHVWQDVESVVLPQAAAADRQDHAAVSTVAYWAWKCGQWKAADEAFRFLGKDVDPSIFGGKENCEAARAESAAKAAG